MKKLCAALLGSILFPVAIFPQAMNPVKVTEDVIKKIENELAAALEKGDAATVDSILADDYVEITPQGALLSKEDLMMAARAKAAAPRAVGAGPEVSVEQTKLKIYGEVAVFFGLKSTRYPHMQYQVSPVPGQPQAPVGINQERFMKIYAKRSDHWQLVAAQSTAVTR